MHSFADAFYIFSQTLSAQFHRRILQSIADVFYRVLQTPSIYKKKHCQWKHLKNVIHTQRSLLFYTAAIR